MTEEQIQKELRERRVQKININGFMNEICDLGEEAEEELIEKGVDWIYRGKIPCVLDLYSEDCTQCKVIKPVLEDLAEELEGKVNFFKIDIENDPMLATVLNVHSLPTLLFIPMDGMPTQMMGAKPKGALKKLISEHCKVNI